MMKAPRATEPRAAEEPGAACAAGIALHDAGRYADAVACFRRALARDPEHAEAYNHLGRSLNNLQRLDEAARAFQEALLREPGRADMHDNLGHVLRAQGALEEAAAEFAEAVRLDPRLARAHRNLGITQLALGRPAAAIECLERAVRADQGDARAHLLLAAAWPALGELEKAADSYRRALALEPDNAEAHLKLGLLLSELQRADDAEAELRRAVELEPHDAQAWVELAAQYERNNRLDDMRPALERALELSPGDPRIVLEAARRDRRAGDIDAALARLQDIDPAALAPRLAQLVHFELGRLLDRRDEADAAFGHFAAANRLAAAGERMRQVDPERFLRQIDALHACFSTAGVAAWAEPRPLAAADTPVFLLGFPRSGTTLTDVLLDGHPRIRTLEEKPTIDRVIAAIERNWAGGFPAALPRLTADDIDELRTVYFSEVERHAAPERDRILVDKLPIRTVHTGVIWRLFPRAKILFALRHPCDVCLSGFMQQYHLTDAFANFFTLGDTVRIYDKVMRLWNLYVSVLELDCHVIRYERLVDDLEGEMRRLIDFLGVPWDDGVLDHTRRAHERGRIRTSSYHQVTEPIYRHARGRWLRYRKHLEPHLERLAPHVSAFGYELA